MGRQPNISFANLFDTVMLTVWHKSAKKKKKAVNDNVFLTEKRGKKLKKKCIIRILVVN